MAVDWSARVAALEEALCSGHLTVEYEGRRITYKSTSEIMQALTYAKTQTTTAGTVDSYRVSSVIHSRD